MKKLFDVKLSVKAISYLSMFIALQIVLEMIFQLFPGQPQGGNISIDLLPILLTSYLMGSGYGLLAGFVACLLHFTLGLATFYGPWSVLLDYLIPLSIVGLSSCFKNIKIKKNTIYSGIIITMFMKFMSHYISGAWLFKEYAPAGMNSWVYSFSYNIIYCLPTCILCYLGFIFVYPKLKKVFHHSYQG